MNRIELNELLRVIISQYSEFKNDYTRQEILAMMNLRDLLTNELEKGEN